MGYIGDWIIFAFKISLSALICGFIGWQASRFSEKFDIRLYVLTGAFSTMLVIASKYSDEGSIEYMLGFVISGIIIAVALIASKLISDNGSIFEILAGIRLLYSSVLGILVGAGNIVEAIIGAVLGYLALNYLNFGTEKSENIKDV